MNRMITALAAGGLLLAAGCSSEADSKPAQLNGLQNYSSVQALTDDLNAGGFECDRTEARDTAKFSAESIACYSGGHEYVLSIHLSEKDRDAMISVNETLLGDAGIAYGVVAGSNWSVNCGDPTRCQEIKQIVGGKVIAADEK